MAAARLICRYVRYSLCAVEGRCLHSLTSVQKSLQSAIEAKCFIQIPHLLSSCAQNPSSNPFSFLFSHSRAAEIGIIDEILQYLLLLRPRRLSQPTYFHLLLHTLADPDSLPLSLVILQHYIRSGSSIPLQIRLSLSSSWIRCRQSHTVAGILSEARGIGYPLDRNVCNYLLTSLCTVDDIEEAIAVLREMRAANCVPDSESYDVVLKAVCKVRRTDAAAEMLREMVDLGIFPRQGCIISAVSAMRANREVWRAKEMIFWLEAKGIEVGFQCFQMVLMGCIERGEFLQGGELVMAMAQRGFIPYMKSRQRVVEGLTMIGEFRFAAQLRQRLADLSSQIVA